MRRDTETMLMLSDTSFTTHASSLLRGFTDTGSIPTGISAIRIGLLGLEMSNTDNRASGVFTAKSRVASGETRIGLTCLPSKLTKLCPKTAGVKVRAAASRNLKTALIDKVLLCYRHTGAG